MEEIYFIDSDRFKFICIEIGVFGTDEGVKDSLRRFLRTPSTAEEYVSRARQVAWNVHTPVQALVALIFIERTADFIINEPLLNVLGSRANCQMHLEGISMGLKLRWNLQGTTPELGRNLSGLPVDYSEYGQREELS